MKTVYISHTKKFNFQKDLYKPLKQLSGFKLILPHAKHKKPNLSKNIIKKCSAFITDVSYPSYGIGIEIG